MKYKQQVCCFALIIAFVLIVYRIPAIASTAIIMEDQPYPQDDLEALATPIADYCHFNKSMPFELILDGNTLKTRLTEKTSTVRQYLLINDVTLILNETLKTFQPFILCGIREWLVQGGVTDRDDDSSGSDALIVPPLTDEEGSPVKRLLALMKIRDGDLRTIININQGPNESGGYNLQFVKYPAEFNHLVLIRRSSSQNQAPLLYCVRARITMRDILIDDLAERKTWSLLVAEGYPVHIEQAEIRTSPASYRNAVWMLLFNGQISVNGIKMMIRGKEKKTGVFIVVAGYRELSKCISFQNVSMTGVVHGLDNRGFWASCFYGGSDGSQRTPIFLDQITLNGSFGTGVGSNPCNGVCWFQTGESGISMNSTHPDARHCDNQPHIGNIYFSDGHVCRGIPTEGIPDDPEACYTAEMSLPTPTHCSTPSSQITPAAPVTRIIVMPTATSEAIVPEMSERSGVAAIKDNMHMILMACLAAMLHIYY